MSLKIARQITPASWMKTPDLQRLFDVFPDEILLVGGCVRNVLMGKEVEDVDLATSLKPEAVMSKLEDIGVRVIPTGLQHGTVTAVMNGAHYEITTLRHDVTTDGRHAEVAFTDDWVEDAKRRDFTMNTLLMDLMGNVYDPLGLGLEDLDKCRVVFVGEPEQRITEDYLRILRFFRFSAIYGNKYDEDGLKSCKKYAKSIKKLSKERITQEFFKISSSDVPYGVLNVMFSHDVLKELMFSDYDSSFFEHFCTFQSRYSLNALSSRLFVFAAMNFENIKKMEEFILFPKVFLKDMKAIHGALHLPDLSCDHAVKTSLYRFGRAITAQALVIELVQDRVMNGYAPKALDVIQNWDIPDFPVSGDDLIKEGIQKGPELGAELRRREQAWIDGGFKVK